MPFLIFGDIALFKAHAFKMEGAGAVVTQDQVATFFALVANLTVNLELAAFETFRDHALATSLDVTAGVLRFARLLRGIQHADGRL